MNYKTLTSREKVLLVILMLIILQVFIYKVFFAKKIQKLEMIKIETQIIENKISDVKLDRFEGKNPEEKIEGKDNNIESAPKELLAGEKLEKSENFNKIDNYSFDRSNIKDKIRDVEFFDTTKEEKINSSENALDKKELNKSPVKFVDVPFYGVDYEKNESDSMLTFDYETTDSSTGKVISFKLDDEMTKISKMRVKVDDKARGSLSLRYIDNKSKEKITNLLDLEAGKWFYLDMKSLENKSDISLDYRLSNQVYEKGRIIVGSDSFD